MAQSKEAITLGHVLLGMQIEIKHGCSQTGLRALAGMLSAVPGAGAWWCHPSAQWLLPPHTHNAESWLFAFSCVKVKILFRFLSVSEDRY